MFVLSKDFIKLLGADWLASGSVDSVHFVFVAAGLKTATVTADAKDYAVNLVLVMELHVLSNCRMDISVSKSSGLKNVADEAAGE